MAEAIEESIQIHEVYPEGSSLAVRVEKLEKEMEEHGHDDRTSTAIKTDTASTVNSSKVVTLTEATNIVTDAATGNLFRITLTANRTLDNPINATDGQKIIWEVIQTTGGHTLTLGDKFVYGETVDNTTLSLTGVARDFIGVIYNKPMDKFYVVAFVKGY